MHCILPTIERKHTGSIKRIPRKDKTIGYRVEINKIWYYKTHNTYKEALDDLVNKNIKKGLPIKNLISFYPNYIEVELG